MAPKRVLVAILCTTLVALAAPARADEYRAGELLNLDLSKAVLSPKRLGPPAEFTPVAVEARSDAKQVHTTRVTRPAHVERQAHVERSRAEKPRGAARVKLARRHGNPLNAQAMDRSIQTWPCRSGGICDWKR